MARIIKGSEVSGDRPRQMTLWIGTQIRLQWAMYRKHQAIIAGFKASASLERRPAQINPYQIRKKQQIQRGGSLKPERKSLNNHLGNWSLFQRRIQRINAKQTKAQAIRRLNQILLMRLIKRMHQGWKLRNLLMRVTSGVTLWPKLTRRLRTTKVRSKNSLKSISTSVSKKILKNRARKQPKRKVAARQKPKMINQAEKLSPQFATWTSLLKSTSILPQSIKNYSEIRTKKTKPAKGLET